MSYVYYKSPLNERLEKSTKKGKPVKKQETVNGIVLDNKRQIMTWYKIYLKNSKEPIYRKGFSIKTAAKDVLHDLERYTAVSSVPKEYKDVQHVWYDGHISKLPHKSDFTRLCREHILNGETKFRIFAGSCDWDLEFVEEHPSYFVVKDIITTLD